MVVVLTKNLNFWPGVTDFKAVKGSSTSEERNQGLEPSLFLILILFLMLILILRLEPSLFLILAVFGAAICVTASTLCIFITFRRQVLMMMMRRRRRRRTMMLMAMMPLSAHL